MLPGSSDEPTHISRFLFHRSASVRRSRRPPKRIAAILTEYWLGSHADVVVGKYLEGYNQDDQPPYPRSKIVAMFTEHVPKNDMSRPMAKKYGVPIFRTVQEALTLGGDKLAVDGVLLIGEHGDYPVNDKAQTLYPRFEMFLKITDVFRQSGRSVPVFNDKHLSWSWRQARAHGGDLARAEVSHAGGLVGAGRLARAGHRHAVWRGPEVRGGDLV